jgi:hypothetical protein
MGRTIRIIAAVAAAVASLGTLIYTIGAPNVMGG